MASKKLNEDFSPFLIAAKMFFFVNSESESERESGSQNYFKTKNISRIEYNKN